MSFPIVAFAHERGSVMRCSRLAASAPKNLTKKTNGRMSTATSRTVLSAHLGAPGSCRTFHPGDGAAFASASSSSLVSGVVAISLTCLEKLV